MKWFFIFLVTAFMFVTPGVSAQDTAAKKNPKPGKELLARIGDLPVEDLHKALDAYRECRFRFLIVSTGQAKMIKDDMAYLKTLKLPVTTDAQQKIDALIAEADHCDMIWSALLKDLRKNADRSGSDEEKKKAHEKLTKANQKFCHNHALELHALIVETRRAGWKVPPRKQ